jgi:hypothetical protein
MGDGPNRGGHHRATVRAIDLTSDHDGRLVAHFAAEWATTHRDPFVLELEGPAGGRFHAARAEGGAFAATG